MVENKVLYMKDIINIIIGAEDITTLEKYTSEDKEVFERYKNILKALIKYGKILYKRGLSLEELVQLVQYFFKEYSDNVILSGYYKYGMNEDQMEMEVKNMLERQLRELDIHLSFDDIDVDASFSNMSGVEENKTLSLSNGHPTGTETGFASPLILALLTATIEITSLLYIFLTAME